MIELNKDNYDEEVLKGKGIFLVDFWSESCEDCLDITPRIEALEDEFKGMVSFGKVNIKGNRRLAIREKVLGLPSVVIYRDGEKHTVFSRDFTVDDVKNKLLEITGG